MRIKRWVTSGCLGLWAAAIGVGVASAAEAPERPSRGPYLDALMARFGMYDVFPATPVPGHPGADPDKGRPVWERYPQFQNYPGSVEHFRGENSKYIPSLNPFNRVSLVRNFKAVALPGTESARETYAEPIVYIPRFAPTVVTGERRDPVPVVRLKPGGARLRFEVGPLPWGIYVVRVIACLEEQDVRITHPEDLILEMSINDGPDGEVNTYALRQRGTYNFYSMGEFFFRVESETLRSFEIEIGSRPESAVDLLVHNVDVHDRLYATAKRAGKGNAITVTREALQAQWDSEEGLQIQENARTERAEALKAQRQRHPDLADDELERRWRRERDDIIWNELPPLNAPINTPGAGYYTVPLETDPATEAQLKAQGMAFARDWTDWQWGMGIKDHATWRFEYDIYNFNPWRLAFVDPAQADKNPIHTYTLDDLKALKPLPGLPFEVYPWGKRFEDANGVYFFNPVSAAGYITVATAQHRLENPNVSHWYLKGGHAIRSRDLALRLIRWAYAAPTHSVLHKFNVIVADPARNNGRRYAHEDRGIHYQSHEWANLAGLYDQMFPYIQDNAELAEAVGHYVPWVKTPADVIRLLDTHLLQFGAQEVMCFQKFYDHEHAGMLAKLAAIQGDPAITDPWMDSMMTWTWEYPRRVGTFLSFLYTALQRDGSTSIGSFFYAQSGGLAAKVQEWIDQAGDGISPRFSLKDITRIAATPHWYLETRVAGMHHPSIGDVGGANIMYGEWMGGLGGWMKTGWRWTRDPRFAWGVVNLGRRMAETDAEWSAITNAAAGVRNPFFANRSRVLANWGGYLEGGTDSDDFRFRHAARVRIGGGSGHNHSDMLDLGLWSLGLPMAPDGGARPGYGRPDVTGSWMHNVVTVDKQNRSDHAWVTALADMDGAQYLSARGAAEPYLARQVALIEVDAGRPAARPPSTPHLLPGTTYDNDIALPRAYFVDFARARGGARDHAYNFHGPTTDEFIANVTPRALDAFETDWLDSQTPEKKNYIVENEQWGGTVGAEGLTATWRMGRDPIKFLAAERGERTTRAPEPAIMGAAYDPNSPRKYMCLHLPGQQGARFLTGLWVSAASGEGREDGDLLRQVHVIRETRQSLFAAVLEPYAGTPFIEGVTMEEGDTQNADGHAALRVALVGGQRDLHVGDVAGAPERQLKDGTRVQARYAYVSRDGNGLRQVNLVGGKVLELPELTLTPEREAWRATVKRVDYDRQIVLLDQLLPLKLLDGAFFEVGYPAAEGYAERWTNFEAIGLTQREGHTLLRWRKGTDIGLAEIEGLTKHATRTDDAWTITIDAALDLTTGNTRLAAVDDQKRQWKLDANQGFVLYGGTQSAGGLKPGDRLFFHEFGVDAEFRASTSVSLRRAPEGGYRLTGNVPCALTLSTGKAEWSTDGQAWSAVPAGEGGKRTLNVTAAQLAEGPVRVRW